MEINFFSMLMIFLSSTLGAMGLGGGSLLMLYLLFFTELPQLEAQLLNLFLFLPTAAAAAFLHNKNQLLDKNLLKKMLLFGFVGSIIGSFLGSTLEEALLRKLFSAFLFWMSLREFHSLWKEGHQKNPPQA